jgi:hypothetical protein
MPEKKIPPFRLIPEPLSEEAVSLPKFRWASSEIGTRHQLGGDPKIIQRSKWPKCGECGEEMTFYGQLDSINDEFNLADCGIILVFVCFNCYTTHSFIQSY